MTAQIQKVVELEQRLAKLADSYEIVKEAALASIEYDELDDSCKYSGPMNNVTTRLLADQKELASDIRTTSAELINVYRNFYSELAEWMTIEHKIATDNLVEANAKDNHVSEVKYTARMLAFDDAISKLAPLATDPK